MDTPAFTPGRSRSRAAWQDEQHSITYAESSAILTAWKKTDELGFLNDVSSVPLQQTLRHLQTAFTNFFAKRARYPRVKSRKRSRQSAEYTRSGFRWRDGELTLATTAVGVDVGVTSLVTLSTGEKIANPRHEPRDRARLAKAQRRLARKARGSANREKARRKVARVHARIADRRRDFLHKLTTRLVRENQTIVIAVDQWFPSSKTCSACGAPADAMPLSVREWTCRCGAVHDRDINAARNILAAGLAVSACGDGVRPSRR